MGLQVVLHMSSSLKQTFTGTLLDHKKGNWTGLRHKGKPQTRFTTKHDALRSGSELHFHRNFHQSNTYPAQAGYSRKTRMLRVLLCLLLGKVSTTEAEHINYPVICVLSDVKLHYTVWFFLVLSS